MIEPRLFLCNDIDISDSDPRRKGKVTIKLSALGSDPNVHIRLEDVARIFLRHLSSRLVDLIEIASYVYTADCATRRGREWTRDDSIEPWSRNFHFVIPVRDMDFWNCPKVKELLCRILQFLSDDEYIFDFEPIATERQASEYLEFGDMDEWPFYGVERILMFSGGLDSLAGAVYMANKGEKLVLVSHRPVGNISKRQGELFKHLQRLYQVPMIHIPVWINKDKHFGREHTQRTRSFLYSALGTVVAQSIKANGVRFFENGIVSLNLPVADEVIRARASRTTHPLPMSWLSELYSLVTERPFTIDNPFLFKTKAEVISTIAASGASSLIPYTCSCAHTGFNSSKTQWHCGTCSQCIDRRIAIIASGQIENDPEDDYVTDVFLGNRKKGYEQNIAVDYVRHSVELDRMSEEEIGSKFNLELTRAARPFDRRREYLENFIALHKRHGSSVNAVIQHQLTNNVSKLLNGELSDKSMLGLTAGGKHLVSSWKRFAERISETLSNGLPIACEKTKPKNEPDLQRICDALLTVENEKLIREYPFMRWSSSLTKPDWSLEEINLWVELKYVRQKKDIYQINEAIAADITKYGDNGKNVLFVVYDPNHLVTDKASFSQEIISRSTMQIAFIH